MAGHRIHIFGASGSGTSALGRALAEALASQHFDTDDFYWYPTDPPFQNVRSVSERRALMEQMFLPRRDWVLSGSLDSWSEGIDHRFTLAVRMELDAETRLARLRAREARRLSFNGGVRPSERADVDAFLEWAAGYEDGLLPGRNRARHDAWAKTLECPVLRIDSGPPVERQVSEVLAMLDLGRRRP
ncbi:adenylate kinase [Tropicimonas sp.]|uniref:adenylate kinase n=1 Tax=Tropicimonas sp. TaxID=2067044 RepID=UPI003A8A2189